MIEQHFQHISTFEIISNGPNNCPIVVKPHLPVSFVFIFQRQSLSHLRISFLVTPSLFLRVLNFHYFRAEYFYYYFFSIQFSFALLEVYPDRDERNYGVTTYHGLLHHDTRIGNKRFSVKYFTLVPMSTVNFYLPTQINDFLSPSGKEKRFVNIQL